MQITPMNRSKRSNPLNSNRGSGNSMTPSPSSEPLKGGVNHAGTPELTTRDTHSATNTGPDYLKEDPSAEREEKADRHRKAS
jgi:hypothetical protein